MSSVFAAFEERVACVVSSEALFLPKDTVSNNNEGFVELEGRETDQPFRILFASGVEWNEAEPEEPLTC